MKIKVDDRIPTLIQNCVLLKSRSVFLLIGENARLRVVNLHALLEKASTQPRLNVLWCSEKGTDFATNPLVRNKQIGKKAKKRQSKGQDPNERSPFEIYLNSHKFRFCAYKNTQSILGTTFSVLILQDFASITPNTLARTIETVEGGGMVVFLMNKVNTTGDLQNLFNIHMNVHSHYVTESQTKAVARFNKRFTVSLSKCPDCLIINDSLQVLPHSKYSQSIVACPPNQEKTPQEEQLEQLIDSLQNKTGEIFKLVSVTKTLDQAQVLLTTLTAIASKSMNSVISCTASRGRGKSAALGLSLAAAVASGYSNIFVTASSPENTKTLFEFVLIGLEKVGYEKHTDYAVVESKTVPHSIVEISIFKSHRQTIQYVDPNDAHLLRHAELVVIDEAAAIPLPIVKKLFGPYLVILSSTLNGYEGTGRSLSLKLLKNLEKSASTVFKNGKKVYEKLSSSSATSGSTFYQVEMNSPIRYSENDTVERWLYDLLCLDATNPKHQVNLPGSSVHPSKAQLYQVNRDIVFSMHPTSEIFLMKMMSLYVASHYKNTPNDLMIMSDAPGHQLYCLLAPLTNAQIPEILAVAHIVLEGSISRKSVVSKISKGTAPPGDLVPWTLAREYQDTDFANLQGARIMRIAVHPLFQRAGYGKRTLDLLVELFNGSICQDTKILSLNFPSSTLSESTTSTTSTSSTSNKKSPLLIPLSQVKQTPLHYIATSFGITPGLFKFWNSCGFLPVYLRQIPSPTTGEFSCIMIKELEINENTQIEPRLDPEWTLQFVDDFLSRFVYLSSFAFKNFDPQLTLGILNPPCVQMNTSQPYLIEDQKLLCDPLTNVQLEQHFTPFDLKRLEMYSKDILQYSVVLDLICKISLLYFTKKIPVYLTKPQAEILASIGLSRISFQKAGKLLRHPSYQLVTLLHSSIVSIYKFFHQILTLAIHTESTTDQLVHQSDLAEKAVALNTREIDDLDFQSSRDQLVDAGAAFHEPPRKKVRRTLDTVDEQLMNHRNKDPFS